MSSFPDQIKLEEASLRRSILAGSLGMGWAAAALGLPLPMLMENIGASGVLIGLLITVRQFAMIGQIPGVFISEHLQGHKNYWLTLNLLHRLVWLSPAILPLVYADTPAFLPLLIVAVAGGSSLLANLSLAIWSRWMTEVIPQNTSARFWRVRHGWMLFSSLVAMLMMGVILDWFVSAPLTGFAWVFGIAVVFGLLEVYLHYSIHEPPAPLRQKQDFSFERLLAPLRIADFRRLTWTMGAWNFAVGLISLFGIIYLRRAFHASYLELSFVLAAAVLGAAFAGVGAGCLVRKLRTRTMLLLSMLLGAATSLVWFFVLPERIWILPQPIVLCSIAAVFGGMFYAGVLFCQMRIFTRVIPREGRPVALAMHWALTGLLSALAPALGGVVMDWFTAHPTGWRLPTGTEVDFFQLLVFAHILLVSCWALPMAWRIQTNAGDCPADASESILLVNPLLPVRNLHVTNIFENATVPEGKMESARLPRRPGVTVPVEVLRGRLYDSTPEACKEIIYALASLGNEEAAQALITYLQDSRATLKPLAARALGEIGDKEAYAVLLESLDSQDGELVLEAAFALGRLGEKKAAPHLLELFHASVDEKISASAAEALGLLKYDEALPAIFELLLITSNPVFKRSLCLAAGDIIGESEGFYRVLIGESRKPGSEMERLTAQLRKTVRRLLAERVSEKPALESLEQLNAAFGSGNLQRSAKTLEHLYSVLWEGLEARNLSTGKMHLPSAFLRALAGRNVKDLQDPKEILLATYLLLQACPVHPLAR